MSEKKLPIDFAEPEPKEDISVIEWAGIGAFIFYLFVLGFVLGRLSA